MAKTWTVEGVHAGKKMSDLPITYLLWFVGSHQMRRSRWSACQSALKEIQRRLLDGTKVVEAELIADLRPRSLLERLAIKWRSEAYLKNKPAAKVESVARSCLSKVNQPEQE